MTHGSPSTECTPGTGARHSMPLEPLPISPNMSTVDTFDDLCDGVLFAGEVEGDRNINRGALVQCEEAVIPKMRRKPDEPTKEEKRIHRVSHLPFRTWCKHCVKARAKNWPHLKRKDKDEKCKTTFHIDYWFMRDEVGADIATVINWKEDAYRSFGAQVVKQKGKFSGVAVDIINYIRNLGMEHEDIIIKSDQENSMHDVIRDVQRLRTSASTLLEHSPVGDHQANGYAERGIQEVEGMVRTLHSALEEKVGVNITATHPIMTWLVPHCADLLNCFLIGSDGRTPYERLKGKQFHGEMCEFGSDVFFRTTGEIHGGVLEERWMEGIWLGKKKNSGEHIIASREKDICKSASVRQKLESESWNTAAILDITGTPWNLSGKREELPEQQARISESPVPVSEDVEEEEEEEPIARDLPIRKDLLEKFGYASNCHKCQNMLRGISSKKGHTEQCRKRIKDLMAEEAEKRKLEASHRRSDDNKRSGADNLEANDSKRKKTEEHQPVTKDESQSSESQISSNSTSSSSVPIARSRNVEESIVEKGSAKRSRQAPEETRKRRFENGEETYEKRMRETEDRKRKSESDAADQRGVMITMQIHQ